jgi:hypothetical protein
MRAVSLLADEWQDAQFSVSAEDTSEAERATRSIRALIPVVRDAYRASLIFGGAAVVSSADGPKAIGADELIPNTVIGGIGSYNYLGQYVDGVIEIPKDQLVVIDGLPLSRRLRQANRGWGLSYVDTIADAIAQYEASKYSLMRALHKSNLLVYGMEGMADLIGSEDDRDYLREHISDVVAAVEQENILAVDSKSASATFLQRNLTGLKELHDAAMDDVVAKTGLAYSIFWNTKGKTGLGADDSETQHYHQKIDAICEGLKAKIVELAKLLGSWDDSYTLNYTPLHVEDQKIAAETNKINSDSSTSKLTAITQACNATTPLITVEEGRALLGITTDKAKAADQIESLTINSGLDPLQSDIGEWLKGDPLLGLLLGE